MGTIEMRARLTTMAGLARCAALAVAVAALGAPLAQAEVLTWNGRYSVRWSHASNWSPAKVPANGDVLVFPQYSSNDIPGPSRSIALLNDLRGRTFGGLRGDGAHHIFGFPFALTGNVDAAGLAFDADVRVLPGVTALRGIFRGELDVGTTTLELRGDAYDLRGSGTVNYAFTGRLGQSSLSGALQGGILLDGSSAAQTDITRSASVSSALWGRGEVRDLAAAYVAPRPRISARHVNLEEALVDIRLGEAPGGASVLHVRPGGSIRLRSANLGVVSADFFRPAAGQVFTLIRNESGSPIDGQFANAAEGSVIELSGYLYSVSYSGGSGHDLTLTAQAGPAPLSLALTTSGPTLDAQQPFAATAHVTGNGATPLAGQVHLYLDGERLATLPAAPEVVFNQIYVNRKGSGEFLAVLDEPSRATSISNAVGIQLVGARFEGTPTATPSSVTFGQPVRLRYDGVHNWDWIEFRANGKLIGVAEEESGPPQGDVVTQFAQLQASSLAPGTYQVTMTRGLEDSGSPWSPSLPVTVVVGEPAAGPFVTIDVPVVASQANRSAYPVEGTCSDDGRLVEVTIGSASGSATCGLAQARRYEARVDVAAFADGPLSINVQHRSASNQLVSAAASALKKTFVSPFTLAVTPSAGFPFATASGDCVAGRWMRIGWGVGKPNLGTRDCGAPDGHYSTSFSGTVRDGVVTFLARINDIDGNRAELRDWFIRRASPSTPLPYAVDDLNGDGASDLAWFNQASGALYAQPMIGANVQQGRVVLAEADPNWVLVGRGDFNGDRVADLLWRHRVTGDVRIHAFQATGPYQPAVASAPYVIHREPDRAWQIVAITDLDGDQRSDILWRHSGTGVVYAMLIDGTHIKAQGPVYVEPDPAWKIVATGDFAGQGVDNQVVWRHATTGHVYLMTLNFAGGLSITGSYIYREPDPGWRIVGAPDLDGDGKSDLLWHHAGSGALYGMLMNGGAIRSQGEVHRASPEWQVVAWGDFDADDKADIVWRNTNDGQVHMMLMDGLSIGYQRTFYREPDQSWVLWPSGVTPQP